MFEHILQVFGLNSDNSFLNKFFTGITFTVLVLFLLQMPFINLNKQSGLITILLEVNTISYVIYLTLIYSYVKYRRQKIFNFYEELNSYRKKVCLKSHHFVSYISVLIFSIVFYLNFQVNEHFTQVYYNLSVPYQVQISRLIVLFYGNALFFVFQLIYLEFNYKYFDIIENYLNSLKDKNLIENYKPSKDEIISAQQTMAQRW